MLHRVGRMLMAVATPHDKNGMPFKATAPTPIQTARTPQIPVPASTMTKNRSRPNRRAVRVGARRPGRSSSGRAHLIFLGRGPRHPSIVQLAIPEATAERPGVLTG